MILSDREIRIALQRGLLRIVPEPLAEAWSSTAVDLRLAAVLRRWKPGSDHVATGVEPRFRPAHPEFNFAQIAQQFTEEITISSSGFDLEPNRFILGWTLESIRIPNDSRLAARVEGKSSLARLGLGIHVTAPTIHAGFGEANPDGIPLQLEIWNVGPLPIELQPQMRVCQLIFEEVHGTPDRGYQGQFQQQGPGAA
jgi:dCTP deaminase